LRCVWRFDGFDPTDQFFFNNHSLPTLLCVCSSSDSVLHRLDDAGPTVCFSRDFWF
jgi:hypothetical protein